MRAAEGELREVQDEQRAVQNDLLDYRDGLQSAQYELQMARDELLISQGELRGSKEELHVVKDELHEKTALLDGARCQASEAISFAERVTEECRGLRGDLHQQVTLVAQRDEVIGRLRDEDCTHWASRWLGFQRKDANVYPGLDFNFDIPSDEEAEESLFVDYSGEPNTPVEAHSPSSPSAPSSEVKSPAHIIVFFFLAGLEPRTYVAFSLINIHFLPLLSLLAHFTLFRIDFVVVWLELRVWVEQLSSSDLCC